MPKNFIGVIRGANSGTIYAVVNPNDDSELDNPRLLLLGGEKAEAMEMVKVPRDQYTDAMSLDQVAELVERVKK